MSKKVYVGLSGGVDSSVSAALLVKQGYDVVGVYMKNWSKSIGRFQCPWQEDYQDAKRVAVSLGIPLEVFDFETSYFDKVVTHMIDAFKQGITPNPDVMCNQEIKFKLFLETALERGADYIATGHYARTIGGRLLKAEDDNKDQTYFLYRVTTEALEKTIFPIGDLKKPAVRALAHDFMLPTAQKKESMGICFVGQVGIKDFLLEYIDTPSSGPIINQDGAVVGEHDGAIFYTIGQRNGLGVGGGLPYYVYKKDMTTNIVYVTNNIADSNLWTHTILLESSHWIGKPRLDEVSSVRTRHRAPLVAVKSLKLVDNRIEVCLNEPQRAITPGQSAVFYNENECLGGGIVSLV